MSKGTTTKLNPRKSFEDKPAPVSQSSHQSTATTYSQTQTNSRSPKISNRDRESAQLDIGKRIYRAMGSVIGDIKIGKVDPSTNIKSERKFNLSIEVNFDLITGQFEFVEMSVDPVRKNSKAVPKQPSKKKPSQKFKLNSPKPQDQKTNLHNLATANLTRDRLIAIVADIHDMPKLITAQIELIQSKSVEMFGQKIARDTLYKAAYKPLWQNVNRVQTATLEIDPPR
jgi:hypothetical protein